MFRLSSLSCELRRCLAGALLSLPLVASATTPQETFLPAQSIQLPGTMTFGKFVVADVNGDHYDDIVAIGTDVIDATLQVVIDVYLNDGKPRRSDEDVTFTKQRLILESHDNTDAALDKVRLSGGFDMQISDLDNDGKPDILASAAGSGEIFVLWNQGSDASAPFVFVPDTSDPAAPSMTFFSPFAMDGSFGGATGPVLGTPIYVAAANLGDASGRKSIVAYHGALPLNPTSSQPAPFNQRNYESLAIIYPAGSGRGFDIVKQRAAWPGCDLSFGASCVGWNDGMTADTSLYNFRVADQLRLNFDSAASDILTLDTSSTDGTNHYYTPAVMRPNASPGLQVLTGHGANGSDAIWLEGGGQVHEFVADNGLKLMRRRTAIDTIAGNERSAGATFGALSTGATPLVTAGGMRVVYDPSDTASAVTQPVPDYLNRAGQVGAWLEWAPLDSGPALLSLSDYCRTPDPCVNQLTWYHTPLSGDPPPPFHWGDSHTLVMLDFAKETSTPSGTQFEPFFENPDEAHFQAFSIMGGSVTHKPFIAAGHFGSPTESSLVMLDHADGSLSDPSWNHLALYRPDTVKTYASPTPHLDGLTIGRFIEDGLADIGNSLPKGEVSAVLVGARLGTDSSDGIRYVTVHDKSTGVMKGVFPVNPTETVKELSKDGVVVPGLSTLDIGSYTLEVHNATAVASMNLNVVNPFGLTTTNYDLSAGKACGLLPNTKDGNLWPTQIAVSVTGTLDSVDAVRWIDLDDGSVVNLGAEGATFDAAANTVTLIVPQDGKLKDGHWRPAFRANGVWQPLNRVWNVTRDFATLATCANQVDFVNEEAYAQCTNDDYYLDVAQYKVWPHLVNGSFRFFGSAFAQNQIKSAAIKQGTHRYFSSSLELISDNEIHIEFGDLSDKLAADGPTELYFYSETSDVVESQGVPASGGKSNWRTARRGSCEQTPPHFSSITGGSGVDGAFQAGDVLIAIGENLIYPVPTAIRLFLTDKDTGAQYALLPRLPDDFYTAHYDNSNGKLLFVVPNDDEWDQYLITPPEHLTGLPALQVVYSAQAGLTAMSEFTLSKLTLPGAMAWSFCQGVSLAGNTCAGVGDYLIKRIKNDLANDPYPRPGMAGDDEESDPLENFLVTYVVSTSPAEYGLFAAVFDSTFSRTLDQAKFAIYQQGRGRYGSTAQIAWCNDDVILRGPMPGVVTCIVTLKALGEPANIYDVWIPYLATSNQWRYINPATGVMYNTENYQSASAALIGLPDVFAPMSPEAQFFWQVKNNIPVNYSPWQINKRLATFQLKPSNDCRFEISLLDHCYEQPIEP
jgi:hypothetical protein